MNSKTRLTNGFGKGTASHLAEKLGFVSGYRFSDTASRSKSIAPLGAGSRISTFSAKCSAANNDKGFSPWGSWQFLASVRYRMSSGLRFAALVSVAALLLTAMLPSASTEPVARVSPMDSVGPRPVETQTQSSVIRDYLLAWQTMGTAMGENRADLLDGYFVGQAKEKLTDTIREQQKIGIHASYLDKSHDIKVVFYSPEGLSIQLLDEVEYDVDVRNGDHGLGAQHVRARYVAVLTPTESKWKVRVFQSGTP